METIDIVRWHSRTFKDCTYEGQLKKLEEEFEEYEKSGADEELADIIIVSAALAFRFNSFIGKFLVKHLYTKDKKKIVEEKMKINQKRIWAKRNGNYHHFEVEHIKGV